MANFVSRLGVIETVKAKLSFDLVGLLLLVLWVGALQFILDLESAVAATIIWLAPRTTRALELSVAH